jgi:hypothetical protein
VTAKHSHGPNFGRQVDGCPRCVELANGAAPVESGWSRTRDDDAPKTTAHTHQVVYGRREPGCPRCAELDAGAEPVRWAPSRREQDERRAQEIRDHDCKQAGCSIVCTFGDW